MLSRGEGHIVDMARILGAAIYRLRANVEPQWFHLPSVGRPSIEVMPRKMEKPLSVRVTLLWLLETIPEMANDEKRSLRSRWK